MDSKVTSNNFLLPVFMSLHNLLPLSVRSTQDLLQPIGYGKDDEISIPMIYCICGKSDEMSSVIILCYIKVGGCTCTEKKGHKLSKHLWLTG